MFGISNPTVDVNSLDFTMNYSTTDLRRVTSSNTITLNAWNHVAATFASSTLASDAHVYINGVEPTYKTSQDAVGGRINDSSWSVLMGNLGGTFNGLIDEVRVYNRALSAQEVKYLYLIGK